MRLLSNLRVKGKPAVLPDRAIRRQSHYFIYRPRICVIYVGSYTASHSRRKQSSKWTPRESNIPSNENWL